MDWSISIAKDKHHCTYEDPYAEGEQSGKLARPDVQAHAAFSPF